MSLKEIAKRVQLSKISTFRLLRTLEAAGCLVAVGASEYRLAPGIYSVVPTHAENAGAQPESQESDRRCAARHRRQDFRGVPRGPVAGVD